MKLIIALGNLGKEYENSRHNFGWRAADFVAEKFGAKWKTSTKFSAEIAEISDENDEKILLIKPQKFYNLSGEVARSVADFYKIPINSENILIVHDEMDLPLGQIRTRKSGQAAGNNGIANLIAHLGTDFARVRIGSGTAIQHDGLTKPDDNHRDYVLSQPSKSETEIFARELPIVAQIITDFAHSDFTETTYSVSS